MSAEDWIRDVDAITARYRKAKNAENATEADKSAALDAAVHDLQRKGMTSGDALKHLRGKESR